MRGAGDAAPPGAPAGSDACDAAADDDGEMVTPGTDDVSRERRVPRRRVEEEAMMVLGGRQALFFP